MLVSQWMLAGNAPQKKTSCAARIAADLREGVLFPSHCFGSARRFYLLIVKPKPGGRYTAFSISPPAGEHPDILSMIQQLWAPWWGELQAIASEGKLVARASRFFSASAVGPHSFNMQLISDIEVDGACFTDGCLWLSWVGVAALRGPCGYGGCRGWPLSCVCVDAALCCLSLAPRPLGFWRLVELRSLSGPWSLVPVPRVCVCACVCFARLPSRPCAPGSGCGFPGWEWRSPAVHVAVGGAGGSPCPLCVC